MFFPFTLLLLQQMPPHPPNNKMQSTQLTSPKMFENWIKWNRRSAKIKLNKRIRGKDSQSQATGRWLWGRLLAYTPNANMADCSVGARNESHESEVIQSSMFCFDIASREKVLLLRRSGLVFFLFHPPYKLLCSWMPPEGSEIFHSRESLLFSFPRSPLRRNRRRKGVHDRQRNC